MLTNPNVQKFRLECYPLKNVFEFQSEMNEKPFQKFNPISISMN